MGKLMRKASRALIHSQRRTYTVQQPSPPPPAASAPAVTAATTVPAAVAPVPFPLQRPHLVTDTPGDSDSHSAATATVTTCRQSASSCSRPGPLRLKKREKLKARRTNLLCKLDSVSRAVRGSRLRLKRQKTPVVGDMQPMADALPSLTTPLCHSTLPPLVDTPGAAAAGGGGGRTTHGSSLVPCTRHAHDSAGKRRGTPKRRLRQKELMRDIEQFRRVARHPVFRQNPAQVASEHVRQWVLHSNNSSSCGDGAPLSVSGTPL